MSNKARRRPTWKNGKNKRIYEKLRKAKKQLWHNLSVNQDISPELRRLSLEVLGVFPFRD